MQFASSFRIIGILLVIFSLLHLPPMLVSLWYNDHEFTAFGQAFCLTLATGAAIWLVFYNQRRELRVRDGFFIVVVLWTVLSLFGALPFLLSINHDINFIDSFFESVSGLTTTGTTILVGLDEFPKSILYYRAQLQFIGGMGIIVLAVALLPIFGIGGLQLYRAEITGPVKDNKLTPRIKETAKVLWLVYVGLTLVCMISYWWAGMTLFDSICFAFSTISTGGYAPYDMNIGYYPEPHFLLLATFFMLLGGINFALHFSVFRNFDPKIYWKDTETREFIIIVTVLALICWMSLNYFHNEHPDIDNFTRSLFTVVSVITTSGFSIEDLTFWPLFLSILVFFAGLMGACSGSTSGGLKVIRAIFMVRQGGCQIKKAIHPSGIFPLKLGKIVIPETIADAVWGFICVYIMLVLIVFLLLLATGLDIATALSGTFTSIANIGVGLGALGTDGASINETAKIIMSLAMLIGRLEIFTVLVLFTPAFWRG
jgi:trk system potassium uptake protein TrkH